MRSKVYRPRGNTRVFHPRGRPAGRLQGRKTAVQEEKSNTHGLTTLFCCFMAGLLILFLAMPKSEFSDRERRALSDPPEFTARTVFGGTFEDDAEEYISDHFPLRLFFVGLNSYMQLATGRTLINGVYVGRHEWFMQEPVILDEENLTRNMETVREFGDALGAPIYMMSVPSTGYVMVDELPDMHLPYEDPEIRKAAHEALGADATWIDVLPALMKERAVEQVYYRTDHHWTTPGAYQAYEVWAEEHGITPASQNEFTVETYGGFLGTTYAKVLLWGVTPDEIEIWQYPANVTVTTMDADNGMDPVVSDSFYDVSCLDGYDPYAVFFGGNHSVVRIENHDETAAGRLLVIKDSYANSLLPFLARHYKEIVVLDPRYYKNIASFIETEASFDEVLFVYGIGQLVNDQDLGLISV